MRKASLLSVTFRIRVFICNRTVRRGLSTRQPPSCSSLSLASSALVISVPSFGMRENRVCSPFEYGVLPWDRYFIRDLLLDLDESAIGPVREEASGSVGMLGPAHSLEEVSDGLVLEFPQDLPALIDSTFLTGVVLRNHGDDLIVGVLTSAATSFARDLLPRVVRSLLGVGLDSQKLHCVGSLLGEL